MSNLNLLSFNLKSFSFVLPKVSKFKMLSVFLSQNISKSFSTEKSQLVIESTQ